MKYVLVITDGNDPFFSGAVKEAEAKGLLCIRTGGYELIKKLRKLHFSDTAGISFQIGKHLSCNEIAAVFPRINLLHFIGKNFSARDRQYIETECNALYRGWIASLKIPVINHLPPRYWNNDILYAHHFPDIVKDNYIRIPHYIISNNRNDITEFFRSHGQRILYTPQSGHGTYYEINSEDKLRKIFSLIEYSPVTLTSIIAGKILFVYLASGKFFIRSNDKETDFKIPDEILKECLMISGNIELEFLCFSFIKNESGFYLISLSLNPDLTDCSATMRGRIVKQLFRRIGT